MDTDPGVQRRGDADHGAHAEGKAARDPIAQTAMVTRPLSEGVGKTQCPGDVSSLLAMGSGAVSQRLQQDTWPTAGVPVCLG